ncbi:uncharacterized protein ACB058_011847 [Synchiropus picturatus]
MLAEGFVQLLQYKEERKPPSPPVVPRRRTHSAGIEPLKYELDKCQEDEPEPGPKWEVTSSPSSPLRAPSPEAVGLLIPGHSVAHTLESTLCSSCSLLDQYTDLQVAESGLMPLSTVRVVEETVFCEPSDLRPGPVEVSPDQGYLVMGPSAEPSLDLPSSRQWPMSNSLLNGLLDKQLEEVYLQHLTENLARCNSHLGNSLLHGLVPPPKPSGGSQGAESLDACLNEGPRMVSEACYLCTQPSVPCSSTFSSPVLRISEADNCPTK